MVRIHFLGTSGWYDTDMGNTICTVIEHQTAMVVLDAGNGIYKLDSLAPFHKPFYLVISHLHLDHICGLHALSKLPVPSPFHIFVPKGQTSYLEKILDEPFTINVYELPFEVILHELPDEMNLIPYAAQVYQLQHSVLTIGIRLIFDNLKVAYCPDTGFCQNAIETARNADILIAECAYRPGEHHPSWPHLNPETAAQLALEAGVRKLYLTHFDAYRYKTLKDREEALIAAQRIFPHTTMASDNLIVEHH